MEEEPPLHACKTRIVDLGGSAGDVKSERLRGLKFLHGNVVGRGLNGTCMTMLVMLNHQFYDKGAERFGMH
jgi:hypothetical protein